MATRNQIIETLFTGKNFNDCINKIEPAHLRDDLKQEVSVIICEWIDEKVEALHERGELEFYVVRVILNMISNKYHPFHKKYRSTNIEFKEIISESYFNAIEDQDEFFEPCRISRSREAMDEPAAFRDEERLVREIQEDFTLQQIDSLYWYDRDMLKAYLKLGTYRAIEDHTGIPHVSCYKNIMKSLDTLRKKATAPRALFTKQELSFIQNQQ